MIESTDSAHPDTTAQDADALFSAVYDRLKALAGARLAQVRPHESLDATGLVHELYLRFGARDDLRFSHPALFFAYAAKAMRHLLGDRARDRLRQRAGGDWQRVTLSGVADQLELQSADQALHLERSLQKLEAEDARAARVVELRYFAGLSLEQTADTLGLARRTVDRDWRFARAFLQAELG